MWPFRQLRELRELLEARTIQRDRLQEEFDRLHLNYRQYKKRYLATNDDLSLRINQLNAAQKDLELANREIAHLRAEVTSRKEEIDLVRRDLKTTIEKLGQAASVPIDRFIFEQDPFREQDGPSTYLTPQEDKIIPRDVLERAIDERPQSELDG